MLKLPDVKNNSYILEFIEHTDIALNSIGYTDHGIRHAKLVSERAQELAKETGLSFRKQELCAMAGFCHDMGNFLSRTNHHYWAALLFSQIFMKQTKADELTILMQAISNHDREDMRITDPISAIVVLADKSDVHHSRVRSTDPANLKIDIHDRVNYAVQKSLINVGQDKKEIKLILKIDVNFCPIMEYFAIFTDRMMYCREAAKFLGYKFGLEINNFTLL